MNTSVLLWESPHPGLGLMSGPSSSAVPSAFSASSWAGAPSMTLQGMTGAINEVAFTCDCAQVGGKHAFAGGRCFPSG